MISRIYTLVFILLFFSCGGGATGTQEISPDPDGTEIGNPSAPKVYHSQYYDVVMKLQPGWEFIEYNPINEPGEEAFKPYFESTPVLAHFSKSGLGFFTIFISERFSGESLFDFIARRHPGISQESVYLSHACSLTFPCHETNNDYLGSVATYVLPEVGPRGGFLFETFVSTAEVPQSIVWMRTELIGSPEQKQDTLDEFFDIVATIDYE